MKRTKATPAGAGGKTNHTVVHTLVVREQKGNLLFRDLWQQGTYNIHDMWVVNTDAPTQSTKNPVRYLHEAERGKNRMYLKACLQKCRHFSHFFPR